MVRARGLESLQGLRDFSRQRISLESTERFIISPKATFTNFYALAKFFCQDLSGININVPRLHSCPAGQKWPSCQMPMPEQGPAAMQGGPGDFHTTHWCVVLRAGLSDSGLAQAALEDLCRGYWYPIYSFVRRRGCSPEDAQDL